MASREEDIIRATMEVAAEMGIEKLSLKKVAVKAGCSDALINKYFGSKDNLVKATLDEVWRQLKQEQEDSTVRMSTLTDPDECDKEFIREFVSVSKKLAVPISFYMAVKNSHYGDLAEDFNSKLTDGWFDGVRKREVNRVANDKYSDLIDDYGIFVCFVAMVTVFGNGILSGELPDGEETYDRVYKLIFRGFRSAMPTRQEQ